MYKKKINTTNSLTNKKQANSSNWNIQIYIHITISNKNNHHNKLKIYKCK